MVDEPLHYSQGDPGGFTATVLAEPDSEQDEVRVRVHAFDGSSGRGQVFRARWAPRYAGDPLEPVFPVKGDEGVVLFDEDGGAWMPLWTSS